MAKAALTSQDVSRGLEEKQLLRGKLQIQTIDACRANGLELAAPTETTAMQAHREQVRQRMRQTQMLKERPCEHGSAAHPSGTLQSSVTKLDTSTYKKEGHFF